MRTAKRTTASAGTVIAVLLGTTTGCFGLFSLDGYGPPSSTADADLDAGHDADDAAENADADAGPPPLEEDMRIVFVTSTKVGGGNVGGVEGATARCNELATSASLRGTYRAWLSDGESAPRNTFPDLARDGAPVRLVSPSVTLIAESYAALAELGPLQPIVETERRQRLAFPQACLSANSPTLRVWSNVAPDGRPTATTATATCLRWVSSGPTGNTGALGGEGSTWTSGCGEQDLQSCEAEWYLYCFEQAPEPP